MDDSTQKGPGELPDVQSKRDTRNIPIDRVGVRGVKYPIVVQDRAEHVQHTIGDFTLTVELPHQFKGTHMSRFMEVLSEHPREVSVDALFGLLERLKKALKAERARLEVTFSYFVTKRAPVSHKRALMEYRCGFVAETNGGGELEMLVQAPVNTLCPCSKEISERGAHNQRGVVTARVCTNAHVWLEEIIEVIEASASSPLYPVLKRPDEKWVTEHAYDTPRFVEDMVREVALAFDRDPRVESYEIEVENHESIHAHNAYAYVKRDKTAH